MKYDYYVMVIKNGKAEHWLGIPYKTKKRGPGCRAQGDDPRGICLYRKEDQE